MRTPHHWPALRDGRPPPPGRLVFAAPPLSGRVALYVAGAMAAFLGLVFLGTSRLEPGDWLIGAGFVLGTAGFVHGVAALAAAYRIELDGWTVTVRIPFRRTAVFDARTVRRVAHSRTRNGLSYVVRHTRRDRPDRTRRVYVPTSLVSAARPEGPFLDLIARVEPGVDVSRPVLQRLKSRHPHP